MQGIAIESQQSILEVEVNDTAQVRLSRASRDASLKTERLTKSEGM